MIAAGGAVVAVLIAEAGVRLLSIGPAAYSPRRFEPEGGVPFSILRTDSQPLLVYRPGAVFASVYDSAGDDRGYFGGTGRVVYRINDRGFRGSDWATAKPENGTRVVCLGDSITFGEGVHEEHTYPARLQTLLAEAMPTREVEVINLGVQGYGTVEGTALFRAMGASLDPDVVVVQFFLNDAMAPGETVRQNDAQARGVEMSWPGRASRLWGMVERGAHARRLQGEYFESIRDSFASGRWKQTCAAIEELASAGRAGQYRVIVLVFPILWGLDGVYPFEAQHAEVRRACDAARCERLDLLEAYRGRAAETLWAHPTDHHPNETAHRIAAGHLARRLLGREAASDRRSAQDRRGGVAKDR